MARPGFPVPDDIVPSGSGRRDWVNCVFYGETTDEVIKKRADYFAKYPPQGYDTHTEGSIDRHPDGYYLVRVQRWASCD